MLARLSCARHVYLAVASCSLLFCVAARADDPSLPGPYKAGVSTVTITRPDDSTFTAKVYYPAVSPANNAAFDGSGGAYPMIAFGHGFFQQPFRYFGTMRYLATHGYYVIATESETGLFPNHARMANDMSLTLTYLEGRGQTPGDAFYQHVDLGNAGMSGHSMGAGASLLAASQDSRVRAVADLAVAITRPSPIPDLPNLHIPIALLAGSDDKIVPIGTGTVPVYNAAGAPKIQNILAGGSHVGFQDLPFPLFSDKGPLPVALQTAITRNYLTSYFDLYLKHDQSQWRNIWGPEAFEKALITTQADPGVTLTPAHDTLATLPGKAAQFQVTLTNTGPIANSFSLFTEDDAWSTLLGTLHTPVLASGQSYVFDVSVTAPASASWGAEDSVLLSARSDNDGGTRGFVVLTTLVGAVHTVPEPGTLVLAGWGAVSLIWLGRRRRR